MTKHIVKTEEEWHALRGQYITASEASVLVGADPYSSPKALRETSTFTGNSFTKVGQMLEPVVVKVVNDILGTNFKLFENTEGHKEFYTNGHLGATPDAYYNKILLECKTTRPKTFLNYEIVPPSKYIIQNLVQQICVEEEQYEDYGYLAIMSTNLTQASAELIWPISIFKVWKCDRICDILKEQAQKFKDKPEKFRVESKVKQTVKLLLPLCWEKTR